MTRGSQDVRRLSTVSSVTKPPHYVLTTEWLWFYRGDQGVWVEYGQMVGQTEDCGLWSGLDGLV